MAGRTTKAQREVRYQKVVELLLGGAGRPQIVRHASDKWGVTSRTADNYLRVALGRIGAEARFDRDRELGRAIMRLNYLYSRCLIAEPVRLKLAARIVGQQCVLLGLNAPTKVAITEDDAPMAEWTDKELEVRRVELASRLKKTNGQGDILTQQ